MTSNMRDACNAYTNDFLNAALLPQALLRFPRGGNYEALETVPLSFPPSYLAHHRCQALLKSLLEPSLSRSSTLPIAALLVDILWGLHVFKAYIHPVFGQLARLACNPALCCSGDESQDESSDQSWPHRKLLCEQMKA